jgi:broad specificity phosphatase PhoE
LPQFKLEFFAGPKMYIIPSGRIVLCLLLIALWMPYLGNGTVLGIQGTAEVKPDSVPTTTWLVLRHAERDGENDALTDAGMLRAEVLQHLGSVLNVSAVYSTDFVRTRSTVQPLADSLGQQIQLYGQATDDWLKEIREENEGGVVLIVGHSNTAGVIAGKLAGVEPFAIGHDEYDSLFVVTSAGDESSVVRLKYGQSSEGAGSASPENMGPIKSSKIP